MRMLRRCCKASTKAILFVGVVVGSIASATACTLPDGWVEMQAQNADTGKVAIDLSGVPTTIGTPFDVQVAVCPPSAKTVSRITVDAIMPAHKHGMNYKPDIAEIASGRTYRASGMFFHMPGMWRINVDVYSASGGERFIIELPAK